MASPATQQAHGRLVLHQVEQDPRRSWVPQSPWLNRPMQPAIIELGSQIMFQVS